MKSPITSPQRGFALIGLISVIASVAILIGGGFYWQSWREQRFLLEQGIEAEKKASELKQQIKERNRLGGEVDTSDWNIYRDEEYGFSFRYPPDIVRMKPGFIYPADEDGVNFRFPDSAFVESTTMGNLTSGIVISAIREDRATCYYIGGAVPQVEPLGPRPPTEAMVNGKDFLVSESRGCGAGTCTDVVQYSTSRNGICYRASLTTTLVNRASGFATQVALNQARAANTETATNLHTIFQHIVGTLQFVP